MDSKEAKQYLINMYYTNFIEEILIGAHFEIVQNFIIETNRLRTFLNIDENYAKICKNISLEEMFLNSAIQQSYKNVININQIYDELNKLNYGIKNWHLVELTSFFLFIFFAPPTLMEMMRTMGS